MKDVSWRNNTPFIWGLNKTQFYGRESVLYITSSHVNKNEKTKIKRNSKQLPVSPLGIFSVQSYGPKERQISLHVHYLAHC